jgi:late competence protein required for DNA uptake (superfamily II DNA/RNA helicase)
MQPKQTLKQVSSETSIVARARRRLKVAYSEADISTLSDEQALQARQAIVVAEADAFVRARHFFHG